MCLQKVRGMKVIRLVGDKKNLHNRMKKNWLCAPAGGLQETTPKTSTAIDNNFATFI